jgi:hypothetical protein
LLTRAARQGSFRAATIRERFFLIAMTALPLAAATDANTGCVSCHGMTDSPSMHTT